MDVSKDNRPSWVDQAEQDIGKGKKLEAYYNYRNAKGEYAYTKLRFAGKNIRHGHLVDGVMKSGKPDQRPLKAHNAIYTTAASVEKFIQAARDGQALIFCEGEKDCDTVTKNCGIIAWTTGGKDEWNGAIVEMVRGADLIISRDNDGPGEQLAEEVARDCHGIARSIKIICPSDREKGDISDFFEDGHTLDELMQLILNAPPYGPSEGQEPVTQTDGTEPSDTQEATDGEGQGDLSQFHFMDANGRPRSVNDAAIEEYIIGQHPMAIVAGKAWIYQGGVYVEDRTGGILNGLIRACLYPQFDKAPTIKRISDLFMMDGRLQRSFDEMNGYPAEWVNFVNAFFDPVSGTLIEHDPKYLATTQIPWTYDPNDHVEIGKNVNQFLWRASNGDGDTQEMLLEYIGYCMSRSTKYQKFLLIVGAAGSGKSKLLSVIEEIIGGQNVSHVELKDFSENRFVAASLKNKLANISADLKTGAVEDASLLKSLVGEDTISVEAKFAPVEFIKPFAKLIFSENETPEFRNERSDGIYRRLLVMRMDDKPETDVDLLGRLRPEYPYLISIAITALQRLHGRGYFEEGKASRELRSEIREFSDSTEAFLNARCDHDGKGRESGPDLYAAYATFCQSEERQALGKRQFFEALRAKGIRASRTKSARYYLGIKLRDRKAEMLKAQTTFEEVDNMAEIPFM